MRKFTKDIRFIIAVFVSVFVVLGAAAVNAAASGPIVTGAATPAPDAVYTSTFYFKSPELSLDTDSIPNTDFLVATNQSAVIGSKVYGAAIEVGINPFTIKVLEAGQAQIELSARMRNGEVKTIKCKVVVKDTGHTPDEETPKNEEDGNTLHDYKLSHESESVFGIITQLVFSLWEADCKITEFVLSAEVLQGDIRLGIIGKTVNISYLSGNTDFLIKVTATVNGIVAAEQDIQNCL